MNIPCKLLLWLTVVVMPVSAFGWHDETHLAISKAAGYSKWYNSAGADMTKEKAGLKEQLNHYYDNSNDMVVTPAAVLEQASLYNDPGDKEGHLYGAIIASLREYLRSRSSGKYGQYHLAFCAHYIGDLSQPLHNVDYDDFNKSHHLANDGIVEDEVLKNIGRIKLKMHPVRIRRVTLEQDISQEVARIANLSRKLAQRLKAENRDMTKDEAYTQLGHSASLLKAILTATEDSR